MHKLLSVLALVIAATVGLTTAAFAVSATVGNPAMDRGSVDTWRNFTIVDTNHPAPFDGYFTTVDYYAEQAGDVRFVIVDATDVVTWVSDVVAAAPGAGTLTLDEPVGLTAGSNIGVYSVGYGVISYDFDVTAEPAAFDGFDSGPPSVGSPLVYVGESTRVYSMNVDVKASSPEICKDGGWETYGYKNQGQCIASVVANANGGR
jgi:hypothetical protein